MAASTVMIVRCEVEALGSIVARSGVAEKAWFRETGDTAEAVAVRWGAVMVPGAGTD